MNLGKQAYFKVDPKLAELLGETYRSTEDALKELIDNAYDANAERVVITLPEPLSPNPTITISDNGSGMKEAEILNEYLNVANSRTSRKGDLTPIKKRKVKGRKGIGKFSGLMVAEIMQIETSASGFKTTLIINKEELAKGNYDLETVPLPIETSECDKSIHGTTITLMGLNQNFDFPNPDNLKQILVWDYGRESDFELLVNGEKLGVLDLSGKSYEEVIEIEGKKALLRYTIAAKPIKQSGIIIRVNNKIIGRPRNFLGEDDVIPKKLQTRVYGELICDDLENDVTADFGAIIENSKLYKQMSDKTTNHVKNAVNEVFTTEMNLAKARYQKTINKQLEKLPEYKKPFATIALHKVLEKFYGETDERITTVISVMVEAMEKDHYWEVIQKIQDTGNSDIEKFAVALSEFGLLEMSVISSQAVNRLKFLDELDILVNDSKTLEKTIHTALESSTWIFGEEYSVLFSDTSLKSATQKILDKKYTGTKARNRPDLLLGRRLNNELTLIEFKRPSFTIDRDTERQAVEYRDDLNGLFHGQRIEIILLGGKVKDNIGTHYDKGDVKFMTYLDVISQARRRLQWLIQELNSQ